MSKKIKHTKNELKAQKDNLKRYNRYLPTLILKKQQLQMEIQKIDMAIQQKRDDQGRLEAQIDRWVDLFGEEIEVESYVALKKVIIEMGNVAGIDIPIFKRAEFEISDYDLFLMPLWVDRAIDEIVRIYEIIAELTVLEQQAQLLRQELRITTQRVNLFEKVKIPETRENIRVIQIFMGDQQTAEVVRGKIAKNKLVR
jgi:V/A-type H+-transporting ATPase subunit D